MSNPYPVYGVELHISDIPESVSAVDVVAGDSVPEGTLSFSEVNGELIVLWFSLTGDYIAVGEQDLFSIEYSVNDDAPNGTMTFALTDETTFSDNLGQAMYWNGDSTDVSIGLPDVYLSLVQTSDTQFEIHMDNNDDISGFQFNIDDNPDYYSFVSIEATDRVPADWSVSGNENAGDAILLGFSFWQQQLMLAVVLLQLLLLMQWIWILCLNYVLLKRFFHRHQQRNILHSVYVQSL